MSGHEKFYVPHDDLQELITAIESLDTAIYLLIEKMALPSEMKKTTFTYTTEADDEFFAIDGQVLSTTKDCFLKSLVIQLQHNSQDPILGRDSDLYISMTDEDSVMVLRDNVAGIGTHFANYGDTFWFLARHYDLHDWKLTAGKELQVAGFACNIKTGLIVTLYLTYVEEYVA